MVVITRKIHLVFKEFCSILKELKNKIHKKKQIVKGSQGGWNTKLQATKGFDDPSECEKQLYCHILRVVCILVQQSS